MQNIKKLISEMEEAITRVIDDCNTDDVDIATLIRRSSEAVAVLRCIGDFELKQIMYDMARLAGGAGWTPDDFEEKAKKDG